MIAEIALNIPLKKSFHYIVPDEMSDDIKIGMRVIVLFGIRKLTGFVIGFLEKSEFSNLKEIEKIVDTEPVICDKLFELAEWMSDYYIASLGEILSCMISKSIKIPKKVPKLEKKDILIQKDKEEYLSKFTLTTAQQNAVNTIKESLKQDVFDAFLLFGVTGSGKTEVYMNIMEHVIKQGKSVIFLVPEISLTPQMFDVLKQRFGQVSGTDLSVFHSRMSLKEKKQEWYKIKKGITKIVIGPRSAVFAPVCDLGLIIVDEEHDTSYKQEESPRYNARDAAVMRAKQENVKIILGSATPSLESYYNVYTKKYKLLELPDRVFGATMPSVSIVDMRYDAKKTYILSRQLFEKIINRLNKGEQTILFINRRGSASIAVCKGCGHTLHCDKCDIALTYHEDKASLLCHYCGYKEHKLDKCPECNSDMLYLGIGTQIVEKEINRIFRNAKVARFDSDSVSKPENLLTLLDDFKQKKIDILVGTQMLAKGLDFHNVTLIGIMSSDISLNIPDFRAQERTYQLITQVSGRSGRGNKPGEVIIQSYNPENFSISCSAYGKYIDFFKNEIALRKTLKYPPWTRMVEIIFKGKNENNTAKEAETFVNRISLESGQDFSDKNDKNIRILGPSPMPISYINRQYRWHVLVSCKDYAKINKLIKSCLLLYKPRNGVKLFVNVDPVGMI